MHTNIITLIMSRMGVAGQIIAHGRSEKYEFLIEKSEGKRPF
jgi:hypothetical protein